jgi:hypothetical protein
MSSRRRQEASRRNGALSKGPKTEAGKRRSSENATRHGLLAQRVVLKNEDPTTFQVVLEQHLDKYQPRDGVEYGFIEEMSSCYWRYHRALAIEKTLFDQALDAHPGPVADELVRTAQAWNDLGNTPSLESLLRYQTRLHRMYQRALNNLLRARNLDPHKANLRNEPSPDFEHLDIVPPLPARPPQPDPEPADAPEDTTLSATQTLNSAPIPIVRDEAGILSVREPALTRLE